MSDKTTTIELTMPTSIYKRYVKVAQATGDDPVTAIAYILTMLIPKVEEALEEAEVESNG